ncbi:MAG: T9SS type A sorting domain-containing protein [Bacteroidota bacterium]
MYRIFLSLIIFLFSCNLSYADWITTAEFSEEVGIDSLNRFLVIPDIDTNLQLGYKIINLGDINSDSISDILIQRWAPFLESNTTFLFYGGSPPDSVFDMELQAMSDKIENVGDINGDGFDDIGLIRYISTGKANIEFYFGGVILDDIPDFIIPNMYTFIPKANDLDGDGIVDLPLSKELNDSGKVFIFEIGANRDTIPEYIIADTSRGFGNNLATGDFNGDSYPDLAISASLNRDSAFVKFYWGGPDFDTIPDFEIWYLFENFGRFLLPIEDFNNDGYDDIFIAGLDDQNPYGVYFGGPDIDNQLDIILNTHYSGGGYQGFSDVASNCDVNNDGYNDIITGYSVDITFHHDLKVFLGGPNADSIPDIYLENTHIPGGQIDLGTEVACIGDFNGDGIDDFAARSRTQSGCCWTGEVNLFAGWNATTVDVENGFDPIVPDEYNLKQNYPNPFNPTTTIEFELTRKSNVELTVYDILGRKVASLINQAMPVGSHKIKWDGRNQNGDNVASGIYFYKIRTDQFSDTKKMVLVR